MIEQQFVEIGTRHLIGAVALRTKAVFEIKLYAFGPAGSNDLAVEVWQKRAVEFFAHAEAIERLHAERQKRFTDVKSRKLLPLEDDHAPAGFREQRRRRAARRPATDDCNVIDVGLFHVNWILVDGRVEATRWIEKSLARCQNIAAFGRLELTSPAERPIHLALSRD